MGKSQASGKREKPVITSAMTKLLTAGVGIRETPSDEAEKAFIARLLVQCTLPHSDPGDVPVWSRKNGHTTLSIVPGVDRRTGKSLGYPYGTLPRLLLFWLVTEIFQKKQRRIKLDASLAQFMRQVGLNPATGGGKRGDAHRLMEQAPRLFRAIISFDVEYKQGDTRQGQAWLDMQVAPLGETWWSPKQPEHPAMFESWIEVGEKFYEAVVGSNIPVRTAALKALKRSPLALDLYAWVAFKVWDANRKNSGVFVDWEGLRRQLGCDYDPKRIDHFKDKVKTTMRKIQLVFPDLHLEYHTEGFTVLPGTPPAIAPRYEVVA